jgi:phage terminase large subunit-like protein
MTEQEQEEIPYELERFDQLKRELVAARRFRGIEFWHPYDWQLEFLAATKTCKQIALFAANRVGKTDATCAVLACHLTGDYPDWFDGHRFDFPITSLASGITGDQIRDVLQSKLIGEVDSLNGQFLGGGFIKTEYLGPYIMSSGTKNLLKEVKVKHKNGGFSTLIFRSYEQGPSIIRGLSLDWILIDEEPNFKGMEFYAECLARTATGNKNKGGFVVITFTPENGITELVDTLLNKRQPGQHVMTIGWDRAPHLDERTKTQLLKAIPRYMLSAKTQGIPNFGDTQIFKVMEEDVVCQPFPIPDYFSLLLGIDFGIAHPFAAVFAAHDRDRDIIYIYDCFKASNEVPAQHAHKITKKCRGIRVIYPQDGDNREKGSGETLRSYYEDAGINMYRQFENLDGSKSVEVGIMEMETRMQEGRLKVFSNLVDWFEEFRKYHRNQKTGKIVKVEDDLMDASRYVIINIARFGQKKQDFNTSELTRYYPNLFV